MAGFSPELIADIANTTLETFLKKGTVIKQQIQAKPMLDAFNEGAGKFTGGKEKVSYAVGSGKGGQTLQGYTGDDQVTYGNPVGVKRASAAWKEHHIGTVLTMSELKTDGINVDEDSYGKQSMSDMPDREVQALANRLDESNELLAEDYAVSLDTLVHGDGSADTKALAGIRSLILDSPAVGSTLGISRVANSWWRNRAATAAFGSAGGQGAISSATTDGGVLITFLEKEIRQLKRFGTPKHRWFAGSAFIDAYLKELRANGNYSQVGWMGQNNVDGGMDAPKFKGAQIEYDPTLDDLSLEKRCYVLDMSARGLKLMYMDGQRMKKHKPARPHDRYVIYNGITMTGVMIAYRLNSSAVYDIA